MKKAILSLGAIVSFIFLSKAQEVTSAPIVAAPDAPEITFETETIDYGTIQKGADGVREFKFKNTGKSPLLISGAQGSCGCTVPEHPKEPIPAGGTGVIKVKYNTDLAGPINKSVTVNSNAKTSPKILYIKGEVKAPAVAATDAVGTVAPAAVTPAASPAATTKPVEAAPAKTETPAPATKPATKKKTKTAEKKTEATPKN